MCWPRASHQLLVDEQWVLVDRQTLVGPNKSVELSGRRNLKEEGKLRFRMAVATGVINLALLAAALSCCVSIKACHRSAEH